MPGMTRTFLHVEHLPLRPALDSSTLNFVPQCSQENSIILRSFHQMTDLLAPRAGQCHSHACTREILPRFGAFRQAELDRWHRGGPGPPSALPANSQPAFDWGAGEYYLGWPGKRFPSLSAQPGRNVMEPTAQTVSRLDRAEQPNVRRRVRWVLIGLVLINLGWRVVRYGLGFPIWGDEAITISSLMSRDFAGMLRPLDYLQTMPLGFMWAELAVGRAWGFSGYSLRLIPFVCGIASMLLFWRLAVAITDRRGALLAVAIMAASYYPVRHGCEVKPYAIDMLVSTAVIYLGWIAGRRASTVPSGS